jgi:hypothetical protein
MTAPQKGHALSEHLTCRKHAPHGTSRSAIARPRGYHSRHSSQWRPPPRADMRISIALRARSRRRGHRARSSTVAMATSLSHTRPCSSVTRWAHPGEDEAPGRARSGNGVPRPPIGRQGERLFEIELDDASRMGSRAKPKPAKRLATTVGSDGECSPKHWTRKFTTI